MAAGKQGAAACLTQACGRSIQYGRASAEAGKATPPQSPNKPAGCFAAASSFSTPRLPRLPPSSKHCSSPPQSSNAAACLNRALHAHLFRTAGAVASTKSLKTRPAEKKSWCTSTFHHAVSHLTPPPPSLSPPTRRPRPLALAPPSPPSRPSCKILAPRSCPRTRRSSGSSGPRRSCPPTGSGGRTWDTTHDTRDARDNSSVLSNIKRRQYRRHILPDC